MTFAFRKNASRSFFATSMGSACICAWLITGDSSPFMEIETGLSLLRQDFGGALSEQDLDDFLDGGKDTLASIGVRLFEKMKSQGENFTTSVTGQISEMKQHLADRRDAIHEWAGDSLNSVSDRLFRVSACTVQQPNDLPAIDAGKGFMDTLYNVVKVWALYKVVKKAFSLASDEIARRRDEGAQRPQTEIPVVAEKSDPESDSHDIRSPSQKVGIQSSGMEVSERDQAAPEEKSARQEIIIP